MNSKPYSPACERNSKPILKVLKEIISPYNNSLLEIGSGTGQHAVYLAPFFNHITWTTSDLLENHEGIKMWMKESNNPSILGPIKLKIGKDSFPKKKFDLVFTANTFHIMSWKECKTLMKNLGTHFSEGAQIIIYGPFKYEGKKTSQSNEDFDLMLKKRNPASGIRFFEDIHRGMEKNGLKLLNDYEMPANNRILVYTKIETYGAK